MRELTSARSRTVSSILSRIVVYALLSLGGLSMLLPFYWMLMSALKTPDEIILMPPKWIPGDWQWGTSSWLGRRHRSADISSTA